MFAQTRDLSGLRVEEGRRGEIPQTGDPLDGTWTRPDPALRRLLFVQQAGAILLVLIMFLAMFGFIALSLGSEHLLEIALLMSPVIVSMAVLAGLMSWMAGRICSRHRFRITDEELVIEHGLITTNKTLVPLVQIQQVNVIETWLGNRYGIKHIVMNTAGFAYIANAGAFGGTMLLGLRNADEVAEAILSRVKKAKGQVKGD